MPRYRGIGAGDYHLVVLEAGEEILRGVHPTLAARANRRLGRDGIEVRTRTRVTRVLPGAVEVAGGEPIVAGPVGWARGAKATPDWPPPPPPPIDWGGWSSTASSRFPAHPRVTEPGDR